MWFPCGLGLPVLSLDWLLLTSSLSSPGCSHPGLSWLPLMVFDFVGLVVWLLLAPWSWNPPSRSVLFSRLVTFWRLCDASRGPLVFPRSLRRSLASCLAAFPFASLPLVSCPWTVLSWSHLLSVSPVSDRFVVVPRQLVGLGGRPPALPNCPPHVRRQLSFGFSASLSLQVFAMRSPCRVESVSVLDRNEGSYYTFLVFGRSLRDEVTLTGRVFLRSRLERRLFEHLP